jgi:hypothetical protein
LGDFVVSEVLSEVLSEALSEVLSSNPFPFKGKAGMGMGFGYLFARFTDIHNPRKNKTIAPPTIEDG